MIYNFDEKPIKRFKYLHCPRAVQNSHQQRALITHSSQVHVREFVQRGGAVVGLNLRHEGQDLGGEGFRVEACDELRSEATS